MVAGVLSPDTAAPAVTAASRYPRHQFTGSPASCLAHRLPASEIVADPHREARLAEPLAAGRSVEAALIREQVVFPGRVEEGGPRPVEVNRVAECEDRKRGG